MTGLHSNIASKDEVDEVRRDLERYADKIELRIEHQLDAIRSKERADNVVAGPGTASQRDLDALERRVIELEDMVSKLVRTVEYHQVALEELSFV